MSRPSFRIYDQPAPDWVTISPGIRARPMVEGNGSSIILYRIDPGNLFELHSHPFVELGVVLGGRGRLRIGEEERVLREGDSFYLPSGILHGFVVDSEEPVVMMNVTAPLPLEASGPSSSAVLAIAREAARPSAGSPNHTVPKETCAKGCRSTSAEQ